MLKDCTSLLEGETEARLIGELHVCVPECPQERAVDPFAMADGTEEGGTLLLGRIEIS